MAPTVHVFVILLGNREFETGERVSTGHQSFESGDPILWDGEEAIVLGSGLTRSEAKARGTAYYNEVSTLHGEDGDWDFNTQGFDQEPCSNSDESDEDQSPPRKKQRK